MSDYAQVIQTLRQEAAAQASHWRNADCHPLYLLHPQPTRKVCLFFHGFTAAPYQFTALAQTLFQAGYNVVVPLLPGHGLAGDWGPFNLPPLPTTIAPYQAFAELWLERARAMGEQIVIGGLSGGATLAAWLGLEHPRAIAKTLVIAPYFGSSDRVVNQLTRQINRYQEWLRPQEGFVPPGYGGFEPASLRGFLELGEEILRRSQYEDAPSTFIIASASDRAITEQNHQVFFRQLLRYQPNTWYLCFDSVHDIPHSMLTREAVNQAEFLLTQVAKAYIESDLTWAEIAEIGHRMARGQVFPAAVQQLGLKARAAVDLPTLMALMDKRQFLDLRQRQQAPYLSL